MSRLNFTEKSSDEILKSSQLGNSTEQAKGKDLEISCRLEQVKIAFSLWDNNYPKFNLPQIPTVNVYNVLRDGKWVALPTLLISKNDIIQLQNKSLSPCNVQYLHKISNPINSGYRLNTGQKLLLDNLYSYHKNSFNKDSLEISDYIKPIFIALDTPLEHHLDLIYKSKNHSKNSVFENHFVAINRTVFYYFVPTLLAVIFIHGLVYLIVNSRSHLDYSLELFFYRLSLLVYPIGLCFPCIYLFKLVAITFGNSQIIVLSNVLQQSKTDFEDLDFIDEFDADAPPPTKDVNVSFFQVFKHMIWISLNPDYKNLSRYSKLVENLSSITTFCSIDQEGTISHSEPEELVVPINSPEKILTLEISKSPGSRFGYSLSDDIFGGTSLSHQSLLLPIANLFVHHAFCNHKLRPGENHSRIRYTQRQLSIPQANNFCLCDLGKHIGIQPSHPRDQKSHLYSSSLIYCSPAHPSSAFSTQRLGLPTVESTVQFVSPPPERLTDPINVNCYSSGDFDLILSLSSSMWTGSDISELNKDTITELFEFYESTKVQDLRCLAFSIKSPSVSQNAISMFSHILNPVDMDSYSDIEYPGTLVNLDLDWGICEKLDHSPNSNLNLNANANESDSEFVNEVINNNLNGKIASEEDSKNSAQSHDSHQDHKINGYPFYFNTQFKRNRSDEILKSQILANPESEADYSIEYVEKLSQKKILSEIVDDQIFLGLVTFCNNPKTDVCDFIEDLSLAGIRFVYFSKENGQVSKAFAERLGLETDWNTCILLSSENSLGNDDFIVSQSDINDLDDRYDYSNPTNTVNDSNFGGGYHEDYEIKAHLPRGIDEIKQHLDQVDDIPLQVSLFAECTSSTTSQMLEIFSEYGEIVCVVGSMLQDKNSIVFLNSHLSFAVDPLCHQYSSNTITISTITCIDTLLNLINSPSNLEKPKTSSSNTVITDSNTKPNMIPVKSTYNQLFDVAAVLNSLCCPLFLLHDTSFYTVLQLASESRRLVGSLKQGLLFLAGCYISVFFINLICILAIIPPALDFFAIFYLLVLFVPITAFTYAFVSPDPNCMSQMPPKNNQHVRDLKRFCVYGLIRLSPIVISTLLVFFFSLYGVFKADPYVKGLYQEDTLVNYVKYHQLSKPSVANREDLIAIPQFLATLTCLFNLILFGATMMHRTTNSLESLKNKPFLLTTASFLILSTCIVIIVSSTVYGSGWGSSQVWKSIPFYVYIFAILVPITLLIPAQELCKRHDNKRYSRYQKIAKLEFNTKLGLHSPL
ncbi:hypothetical protein AYI68_g354 [Smittium mucronatum]|uniref:Uncharacterized protein n=1 Tax=Smittium mucronatum TaxID=133383 RepID=A0A1R0H8D7_9FUNG|nr:hypothetical protein AYI68_g354 [Smittium mucronatum]